jgi:predicted nucleotidyltransferase
VENSIVTGMILEKVHQIEPKAEIILFGSRARGEEKADSDWDLLILLGKKKTKKIESEIFDALYSLTLEIDELFTPFIYSREDWEKLRLSPFYKSVESEGMKLY